MEQPYSLQRDHRKARKLPHLRTQHQDGRRHLPDPHTDHQRAVEILGFHVGKEFVDESSQMSTRCELRYAAAGDLLPSRERSSSFSATGIIPLLCTAIPVLIAPSLRRTGVINPSRRSPTPTAAVPVPGTVKNPNSEPPGKPSTMVKYQIRGGFVPLKAEGENGSEHPHTGTGFGLNLAIAWPLDDPGPPPYSVLRYRGSESYRYFEVHQLSYDGETFRVLGSQRRGGDELLDGWTFLNGALRNGIADGEDLLVGMVGGRKEAVGSGVMRWRRKEGIWRPVSYVPVTADDGSFEPSLVRDLDGHILFAARGRRGLSNQEPAGTPTPQHDIRVWRSHDGGKTWTKVIHVGGAVSEAPITLNQAVDGTPYIVASQYQVFIDPMDQMKVHRDEQGQFLLGGRSRNRLVIWTLNADRDGLERPILVRDLREDWGRPPGRSSWWLDHSNAMTVRLADGQWHSVLACESWRSRKSLMPWTQLLVPAATWRK